MKPILLFEEAGRAGASPGVALARAGVYAVRHASPATVVQSVLAHAPRALVWALRRDPTSDLGTLSLIRLVCPHLPLLLLEHDEHALPAAARRELRPRFVSRLPRGTREMLRVLDSLETIESRF